MTTWDYEMRKKVASMIDEGMPVTRIAAKLGSCRNAVSRFAKLRGETGANAGASRPEPVTAVKPSKSGSVGHHAARGRIQISDTARAVMNLEYGECKFPIGMPRSAGFRFCCKPVDGGVQQNGRIYCTEHRELSVRPYEPRVIKKIERQDRHVIALAASGRN